MRSKYLVMPAALLLGAALAGCGAAPSPSTGQTSAALSSNGVNATLTVQPSTGSRYCATVALANTSTSPVTNWTVLIALNGSRITSFQNATYTATSTQVTAKALSQNANIAPGASASFSFCATSSSGRYAALSGLTITGGATTLTYTLAVQVSGSGTTTPAAGTSSYAAGTTVQVAVTPAAGFTFAGWSGAATGSANPLTVVMNGNKTLTATFTPVTQDSTVRINAGGAATGTFGADADYSGGRTYSTTKTVDTSLVSGTVPPQAVFQTERYGEFTYTVPNLAPGSAQSVTLYFAETYWTAAGKRTFDVAINGTTVLGAFDIFVAAGGTNKAVARTFNAAASATGQVVVQFTSNGGSDNPKVSGLTVAAGGVAPTSYALTVKKAGTGSGTVSGTGIDCGTICTASYTSGTSVTLAATAASGSTFTGWSGACAGTAACTVAMSAAQTVTATFDSATPASYALTVKKAGAGSGTVSGTGIDCGTICTASYTSGTSVTLTATAASGSTFTGWSGACTGTAICTVAMSAAQTVTATFKLVGTSTYLVSMVQSAQAQASDISQSEVAELVSSAITQAGGIDFIKDGQTVVLKPNLVSVSSEVTVNGITTDWRVVKAVADLVRAKNPSGKILVMEGSTGSTAQAYSALGYTFANFGAAVDEFIAVEGTSCSDTSTSALVQRTAASGKAYWINSRYVNADVVISVPTLKTHYTAGITGAVKNLGIGMTPVGLFSPGNNGAGSCTRTQSATYIDHSSAETLGQFIRDYYGLRPADFAVMDGLQGLQHGPNPIWDSSGTYTIAASKMNMRLIMAGRNPVALDTIASLVMKCDPTKVPHLTKLEADGLGTTDASSITVVGKQVSEVAKPFASAQTAICPGQ